MGPNVTSDSTPLEGPPPSGSVTWTSSRATRQRKNREREKSADPAELLSSSSRTSELKRVRRNDLRQTRHKSKTTKNTRSKKNKDPFEDQGMSMSLTLKVGSGMDEGMETSSIMTCKRMIKSRNAEEDHDMLTDPLRPSRTTPEDLFGTEDDQSADYGHLEKKWLVCLDRGVKQDDLEQEELCFTSIRCSTNPLKRSLSCPDISLQRASDVAPSAPFIDDKTLCYPPSPPKRAPDSTATAPSPVKRTRRHTVCSVEIEREIAPLCLRKEVYPAWGSKPGYSHPHSPSKSLSSLISRFLSSPLAFRSTKSSRGHADDSGYAASRSDLGIASSSSPSPISLRSPAFSSSAGESAFFNDAPHTPGQASVSSQCSGFDSVSMEAAEAVIQQGSEGNQRSSLISEEKALSDSEIKPDNKQVERRKVSSIRIRKTLPKPQYNLTPMGLPKAVRIKKKVFSVEEIYTNKNFSKPPEGRLETIFEVPLSRRDGSQSLIGPKRLKRFVEFPELGMARKPRRPLVGGAGGGGAQRKAAGNSGTGRTRRCREEEAVHVQDFDSLLCSKLDELDLWMATEDLVY
ncbi:protein PRR14L-like [Silurus meridionalis]|uniref:Tantalus-like domain-containing protein n=1 Tax=Silurus meridionalis TaxID=175797 RepID=A0A8T0AXU7_SILME|nr:protein PRR14L-like [Silurus meridionalis]XP_046721554.1 protein PRR14L-like [Silurus meridionalis]KAF7697776.1 hypothetical protein HF521_004286 [Silurus meridionalis]